MALTRKEIEELEKENKKLSLDELRAKLDEVDERTWAKIRREEEEEIRRRRELREYNIAHGIKDCMIITREDYEYMIERMSSVDTSSFKKFPKGSKEREEEIQRILQRIKEVHKEFC